MPKVKRHKHKVKHNWFLPDWMKLYGKKQADLVRDLDWQKGTASRIYTGKQRYTQDIVDELAVWLAVRPFELLLHPDEAMSIRRLREAAAAIVADDVRHVEAA